MSDARTEPAPRVVIVGGGFGGLSAAKALAKAPFDITLIDRNNHHLFQPLLYQVATAALSPADIAWPIRHVLRGQKNARVMLAAVTGVDLARKEVVTDGRRVPYDYLVIATGARHAYFGHDDWAEFAPGLKTIDDATSVRRRILLAFEHAENEGDAAERARLLTFVVIGGGPTGVEMAGAIAELAKRALAADFRSIDPRSARIVLVEAASRVLTPFDETLSDTARRALEQLGVEVRLGAAVTECSADGVRLGSDFIPTRTVIWAAGVLASQAGQWLGAETDRAGRVKVRADLSVPAHPDVFVIGDTAAVTDANGALLPGVAPVAKQQGQYIARALIARREGRTVGAFRYRDYGALATIGRSRAVMQLGRFRISGFIAWVLWSVVHIYFLIGLRNRFIVALNWAWNYITFQRGSRLITGLDSQTEEQGRASQTGLRSKAG
ncbi:MAG: NAD(P)/FAD-dependent oxidoreductase [Xanthobacteraceae bacterium]|nr:NAD(P)/FAD-dependent oxidoreductase [Xanthobacteraceae bacterium]